LIIIKEEENRNRTSSHSLEVFSREGLTLGSLSPLQEEILLKLLDRKPIFQKDLLEELKSKFPNLMVEELAKRIKELANDWRYVYAHETSWGYKVELNSVGESEARRLFERKKEESKESRVSDRKEEAEKFSFFICYRQDTSGDFAFHLKQGLEREGIHAFLDVVDIPKIFRNSEKWLESRDHALHNSDIILLLITIGIEHSREVLKEIALALREGKRFMCLRHDALSPHIEIDLEDKKINLGEFHQIPFDTKEDLLRKVLQNFREGITKPPFYPPPSPITKAYEKHPIPRTNFEITQRIFKNPQTKRQLPSVGFNLFNLNDYPIGVKVEARAILGGRNLGLIQDRKGYYSGKTEWSLNPWGGVVNGNFTIPKECVESNEELTIEVRVTIIENGSKRTLRPVSWTYMRIENDWFYEPRAFTDENNQK